MNFGKTTFNIRILGILFLFSVTTLQGAQVSIHYLGHASFMLQFDNGVSVLTDFGTSNSYGLDSPIYDINGFVPTVVTYSHDHTDHYDENRKPSGVQHELTGTDQLEIDGLKITPVRVCESNPNTESSTAFIFEYQGMTICHLSDAQANIMNVGNAIERIKIRTLFPDQFDLLLMTIEGTSQFVPEAEAFVDLLKPRHIIPMHYWSNAYKQSFLNHLTMVGSSSSKNYTIHEASTSTFTLTTEMADDNPVQVISLTPSPFVTMETENEPVAKPGKLKPEIQNYPNPFNGCTIINYQTPQSGHVLLSVFNTRGQEIAKLINEFQQEGNHSIEFDANPGKGSIPSGVYHYKLETGNYRAVRSMVVTK